VALEEALTLAEHHGLAETLANALDWKASYFSFAGRNNEAGALYELAIAVARRNGISRVEMRSESNLADLCMICDLPGAEDHARAAVALARRWGVRRSEAYAASNLMYILTIGGRLDEAERLGTELFQAGGDKRQGAEEIYNRLSYVEVLRGNVDDARRYLSGCDAWAESDDVQDRAIYTAAEAAVSLAEGETRHALTTARSAIDEAIDGGLGVAHEAVRLAFPTALEAATDVGDLEEADRLVELLAKCPRCAVPPFLQAQVPRAKALVAGARGDDETVEENLVAAETAFRDLGYPYWTALTQLDRAEWLARQGRLDESASFASEAGVTFETVGAKPMAARARALLKPEMVRKPGTGGERAVAQSRPSLSE
jgi:tetratricopeptide (TPR) repeat protein